MTIPLIVAFTPNYLVPAATTLRSVLEASPKEVSYDVVCLVSEIPSEDFKAKLALIDGGTGRLSFRFLNLEHKLQGAYVDPRYTSAANYRLVIAEELPEYRYAIYTDCDIIIRQDLWQLYSQIDMGEAYIAGVAEVQTEWQRRHSSHFGFEAGSYINSGFLVLNLELMRRDKLSERFAQFLATAGQLEFPDQDAINVVCRGRLHYLPPVYNGIRTFTLAAYRQLFLSQYTAEDWSRIAREGNIHYTGEKPWRAYTNYLELWWQTYWSLPQAIRREQALPSQVERLARVFSLPLVRRAFTWWQMRTKKQER